MKKAKTSAKRPERTIAARKSLASRVRGKAADASPEIKDQVGRFMHDHWGALGKDYKLEY
jgi:hypothetical protein